MNKFGAVIVLGLAAALPAWVAGQKPAIPPAASAARSPAAGASLHLVVDDSGSLAGYAAGDGCFDQLWMGVLDASRQQIGLTTFRSWLMGNTVRTGAGLAEVTRFADARRYTEPRSDVVSLLRGSEPFKSAGAETVVAVVTDLEPDVSKPLAGCAGNGSVICLQESLVALADAGWSLNVLGFQTPFKGRRFFYEFKPDGAVNSNAYVDLTGRPVPIYVLTASKDAALLDRFTSSLATGLEKSCSSATIKTLRLTADAVPTGQFTEAARRLDSVSGFRPNPRGGTPTEMPGALLLDKTATKGTTYAVRVRDDAYDGVATLPARVSLAAEWKSLPDVTWSVSVEGTMTGVAPNLVEVRGDVPAVSHSRADGGGKVTVRLTAAALKAAARKPFDVHVRLVARPSLAQPPWEDWSYTMPTDPGRELRTFRTSAVLQKLVERVTDKHRAGVTVAELTLHVSR